MSVFAYIRVSTNNHDQTTENQRKSISDAGFVVDEWFSEDGVSGSVEAMERPAFIRMMEKAKEGDTCIVTAVDRLGRSAADVLGTIDRFKKMGVKLRIMQFDGVDVTSAMGKMVVTVMAAFAEMERNLLISRTKDGLARTKEQGTRLGRPFRLSPELLKELCEKNAKGISLDKLEREYNINRNTIYNNICKWKDDLAGYRKEYNIRQKQYEKAAA